MRAVQFALLLAAPATAYAQTAGDLARQQWPLAIPAATATAPATQSVFGGFDHDVSREIWLRRAPLGSGSAPRGQRGSGAFTSADLTHLRDGAAAPLAPDEQAPYLTTMAH